MSDILFELAPRPETGTAAGTPAYPFRPSEYTAALIQVLRAEAALVRGADALEIGCGGGAVLAALAALGARTVSGIDVESAAIDTSAALLRTLGFDTFATLYQGDMWQPVAGRRFDLIVANLPHFPSRCAALPGRLASWSCGGPDGRELLDRFLLGVRAHLAESGCALITHNGFVDIDLSQAMLVPEGLALRTRMTMLIYLPQEKLADLTPALLTRHTGRSIHRFGSHAFAEMHIAEIRAAPVS